MNDAEIIKALECCSTTKGGDCKECPFYAYEEGECQQKAINKAHELSQRQQAEIEGLQFDISELSKRISTLTDEKIRIASQRDEYLHRLALGVAWDNKPIVITSPELTDNVLSIACNNAIKEFAEKLKANFAKLDYRTDTHRKTCDVDFCDKTVNWVIHDITSAEIDNLVKRMTVRIDKNESEEN